MLQNIQTFILNYFPSKLLKQQPTIDLPKKDP